MARPPPRHCNALLRMPTAAARRMQWLSSTFLSAAAVAAARRATKFSFFAICYPQVAVVFYLPAQPSRALPWLQAAGTRTPTRLAFQIFRENFGSPRTARFLIWYATSCAALSFSHASYPQVLTFRASAKTAAAVASINALYIMEQIGRSQPD